MQIIKNNKHIAIVGAGAAGCICAYFLLKEGINVTLFDKGSPLRTLLPTGGGRCNLAHAEYDFKELAKNYPRGEKFLLSAFSKFSTWDTLALFEEMGIKTYTQDDNRIFPESNSAKEVRETILNKIRKAKIVKKEVIAIEENEEGFVIKVETPSQPSPVGEGWDGVSTHEQNFTHVIIATGGHASYELLKEHNINIIEPKPSLVGLNTQEDFKDISGTVCHGINSEGLTGDILFTHFGISGPLVYKISSIRAFDKFPYELEFDLAPELEDLQSILNLYPHKDVRNILKEFLPLKVVDRILTSIFMPPSSAHSGRFSHQGRCVNMRKFSAKHALPLMGEAGRSPDEGGFALNHDTPPQPSPLGEGAIKAHQINGKTRDLILDKIHHFKVTVTGTNRGEETVTAGGVDLDEINPKTMEVKGVNGLYCIGEVLNIDGFCGGFNLQNAWTTAFIASEAIKPSPGGGK